MRRGAGAWVGRGREPGGGRGRHGCVRGEHPERVGWLQRRRGVGLQWHPAYNNTIQIQ